ncbi:MAG: hypothetical protein OQK73_02175 [Gammaproteobacteria bacterium]|nr:hypothetical protein [Gammaproteobacteria bacterium]
MRSLLLLCWQICLFKKGPQDVPAVTSLLWLVLIPALVLNIFSVNLSNSAYESINSTLAVLTYSGSLAVLTALLLQMLGYRQRVIQTLIAMFGSGIILTLVSLPVIFMLRGNMDAPGIWGTLLLALEIWHLFILAHILRHALSISLLLGLMMSFGYLLLGVQIAALFLNQVS